MPVWHRSGAGLAPKMLIGAGLAPVMPVLRRFGAGLAPVISLIADGYLIAISGS